jgi:phospholipase A1
LKFSFIFFYILFSLHSQSIYASETELGDQEWVQLLHDQPTYFLLGKPETKIQFSLKAKLLKKSDLYLAYTQRIFWDLFERSSPFLDINYNPSFFYRIHLSSDQDSIIDIIGYEHESNGKGGHESRSWDRIGARYQSVYHFENGMMGTWSIRAWVPFNYDQDNVNLSAYRGVYELIFTLSRFLGADLSLRLYPGGKLYINPLQGGRELTLRYRGVGSIVLAYAVFQIFQGYAENLLEYDKSYWGFRLGFGI